MKTVFRSQESEFRSQNAEVKNQKSKIKNKESGVRRKKKEIIIVAALACLFLFHGSLPAQESQENNKQEKIQEKVHEQVQAVSETERSVDIKAVIQNIGFFKNDSDFDRTEHFYNPDGQSGGIMGTFFKPQLTLNINKDFRIYYELELGLNFWSKNNPDQPSALSEDVFLMKHREIWAEGIFYRGSGGSHGFKAGYQYFRDPTGLFIAHWIGAASFWTTIGSAKLTVSAGQMPDSTYEGISVDENNFEHDIGMMGARVDFPAFDKLNLSLGLYAVIDDHVIGKQNTVIAPCFHAEADLRKTSLSFDAAVQYGKYRHGAIGNSDQVNLGWAAQFHGIYNDNPFTLDLNLLAMSADDSVDQNSRNYAFYYSGKNRSATLIFTEDEMRDKYDNIDEKMAEKEGPFFVNRAGFMLADAKLSYKVNKYFIPSVILGGAFVLEKENALGSRFAGIEGDLDLGFYIRDYLDFHLTLGGLLPGGAASALVNEIDLEAKDYLYMGEASLTLRY